MAPGIPLSWLLRRGRLSAHRGHDRPPGAVQRRPHQPSVRTLTERTRSWTSAAPGASGKAPRSCGDAASTARCGPARAAASCSASTARGSRRRLSRSSSARLSPVPPSRSSMPFTRWECAPSPSPRRTPSTSRGCSRRFWPTAGFASGQVSGLGIITAVESASLGQEQVLALATGEQPPRRRGRVAAGHGPPHGRVARGAGGGVREARPDREPGHRVAGASTRRSPGEAARASDACSCRRGVMDPLTVHDVLKARRLRSCRTPRSTISRDPGVPEAREPLPDRIVQGARQPERSVRPHEQPDRSASLR